MDSLLFTGGSGLLGKEMQKLMPYMLYPSHNDFNITNFEQMEKYIRGRYIKVLVHAAANTNLLGIENNPYQALNINIRGTTNIVELCMMCGIKLIYISTDYVFSGKDGCYKEGDDLNPVNKYAWSKLGGECVVKLYNNSIIVRTSFGSTTFPYQKAFIDQVTSRETVDKFAKKLVKIINSDYTGVIHVGGNITTVYQYARKLNKKVGFMSRLEVPLDIPRNTSLNCNLYKSMF